MNTPRFLRPISDAQSDALRLYNVDALDLVERHTGETIRENPDLALATIALQTQQSKFLSSMEVDLADFRMCDTLERRTAILRQQGFEALGFLEVEPHPDQAHSIIGYAYEPRFYVWVYAPLGLVYVLQTHWRNRKGEIHQYLGHGNLYYCANGGKKGDLPTIRDGSYAWASLSIGYTYERHTPEPDDLYIRGDLCSDQLLFARLSSLLAGVSTYKKWPAIELRHSEAWSMFQHSVEYGDKLEYSNEIQWMRSLRGYERACSFGDKLMSILNFQPEWKSGDPQNAELADPV